MPIYEYYCPNCKLKNERIQPIEQYRDKVNCTFCGHEASRAMSITARYSNGANGGSNCSACSTTGCGSCR